MTGPEFPEDSSVQVRYPLTSEQEHGDRAGWPWLPGWVVARCGPDEWEICVQASELATWHDGEAWYPVCFRDASRSARPQHRRTWSKVPDPNWRRSEHHTEAGRTASLVLILLPGSRLAVRADEQPVRRTLAPRPGREPRRPGRAGR